MHPKFVLVSHPDSPLKGTLVYGNVFGHRDLVENYVSAHGYVKVHGGGWYKKDDDKKTMLLYGSSGDYGEPRMGFLNHIGSELKDYTFLFSPDWGKTTATLDTSDIEWI